MDYFFTAGRHQTILQKNISPSLEHDPTAQCTPNDGNSIIFLLSGSCNGR